MADTSGSRAATGSLDRRRFLQLSLSGASAVALGAGLAGGRASRASGEPSTPASLRRRHCLPERPEPPAESGVAVVRSADFATHREAVRRAVSLAGGMSFLRPGETVLLKPAVNSPNAYPATSDPETVWIVAEMVKEAGGAPFVADRTMFLRSTETTFRKTGIADAAAQAGIPCRPLDDDAVVAIHHPLAEHWWGRTLRIYEPVVAADHIVNLCTPRTHLLGDFTMALKNNVGVVNAVHRLPMHFPGRLKQRLAEINLVVRPSLVVMDGRLGYTDGGPDDGDLARPGFVAAGSDPLAVDAVGLARLRLEGANEDISRTSIWEIPMMKRAAEIGVGAGSASAIRLLGMDPASEARLRGQLA